MNLMKIAHVPPVLVGLKATVAEAVRVMVKNNVGAVAVVEQGKIKGIFTERDVMKKVIDKNRPLNETAMEKVMTGGVQSVREDMSPTDALRLMVERHFRHLPIVDQEDKVTGILSIRNLLHSLVEDLEDSVNTLTSYYNADGPGG